MAERDLTSAFAAAIAAGTVRPAILFEGEFTNPDTLAVETLRFWTGIGTLPWNTYDWIGAGHQLAFSQIEEAGEIKAVGFSVSLSGQPIANMAVAEEGHRSGQPGKLWLALFDANMALIADPYQLRRGLLDQMPVTDGGETCTIAVQYEDRLAALEVPNERRWTPEDQKLDYSSDLGFDFVQSLQDATFT